MSSKIMIVDDELSMRTYVQMMLEPQGYDLQLLENGLELIDELSKANIPDLIILDVIMPMMNGFEACRKIKANPRWQHIPIILVTVLETKEAILKGMEAGADDFLQKPVNFHELQARVRSMLRIKNQYDELEKILHLREELSNMVIHDMSSPITLIQLHTALLEEQLTDPKQREHLEMIQVAAERLDSFTNDMLMMAKLEHSKLRVNLSEVEINEVILNAEKHFSIMAKSKGIDLKLELPEQPLKLFLDQHLFSRVVANLLTNAIQYSPPQSKVVLRLQNINKHLKLQIIDEGVGIPEIDRERIFNKFEVVELKKKGIKQIGLGLTFCKMAVDAHGGKIYAQENQPHGSIFTVEI
jgi:two-component system, sensor histidine kinase and response regulator